MGAPSENFVNMMVDFMLSEVSSKSMDGITYAMVLKTDADKSRFNKYMEIRKEATRCGYTTDEAFRVYELSNGWLFDMDMSFAKTITAELAKSVVTEKDNVNPEDLIGDKPERRRKADMGRLAEYVRKRYMDGENVIEVALFSRNTSPKITVTGVDPSSKKNVRLEFRAYAIRHWDIETVNAKLLIPAGIRISRIEPCEILPSKTGIRFRIFIESLPGLNIRNQR